MLRPHDMFNQESWFFLTRPFTQDKMLHIDNRLSFYHSVGFAPPAEVAAHHSAQFLKCTLGNIKNEVTWLLTAFTATIIVMFISLSLIQSHSPLA